MTDFERDSVYRKIKDDTSELLSKLGKMKIEREPYMPVRKAKRVFSASNVPEEERNHGKSLGKTIFAFLTTISFMAQSIFK